jgi:hypothetical protein
MTEFKPYADVAQETTINGSSGQLQISSDDNKVIITGDLEIQADEPGLASAIKIRDMINAVIEGITARTKDAPSETDPLPTVKQKNPFA